MHTGSGTSVIVRVVSVHNTFTSALQVIYGDTDSIMVNTRTRDRAACKKLADAIMRKVSLALVEA